MKILTMFAVLYLFVGALTVAANGYREGFKNLYRGDMATPADLLGIFALWPLVWIGFTAICICTGIIAALDRGIRRPAQKIGAVHKEEWDNRQSAIREVERLLTGGKS